MVQWRALAALCIAAVCLAQMRMTVAQLREFVRSSIQMKHDDRRVADFIKKQVTLTERLEMATVEDLMGDGAGPQTINALRTLAEATKAMPKPVADPPARRGAVPPAAPVIPPPPKADQDRIIEEARQIALSYAKKLPDFICLQVTERAIDPSGTGFYARQDQIVAKLSFFEQKENYKVVSINGVLSETPYERLGGATSSGEFGSMMREIFEPATQTDFAWERWGKLRGHVCHVYTYRVSQVKSQWSISWERRLNITPAYRGRLWVDRDVPQVLRITLEAEDLPASFPIQDVSSQLDYDFTQIADSQYLLPMRAEVKMREGKFLARNIVEFRKYQKYGADTSITFDMNETIPEEMLKEETLKAPDAVKKK